MRIRCWVRAISSRCTELTSSSCSRPRSRSARAHASSVLLAAAAGLLDARTRASAARVRSRPRAGPAPRRRRCRRPRRPGPRGAAARGARRRGPAPRAPACGGAQQGVGAAVQRAGPLLGGAQRQPGVHLGLAGRPARPRPAARARWCRAPRRGRPRRRPGAARGRRGRRGPGSRAASALAIACVEPLGLAAGGAGLGAVLAELLGDGGQRGVGLVQLGEGDVDPLAGRRARSPRGARCRSPAARRRRRLGELLGGLVDGRLDLDQARLAATSRRTRSGRRAGRPRG